MLKIRGRSALTSAALRTGHPHCYAKEHNQHHQKYNKGVHMLNTRLTEGFPVTRARPERALPSRYPLLASLNEVGRLARQSAKISRQAPDRRNWRMIPSNEAIIDCERPKS